MESTLTSQVLVETSFPTSATLFPNPSATQKGHSSVTSGGKFILVIDDSPTICRVVEMMLRREGYEIQSFRDGIEAMRWFAGPESRTPDLMLVDLGLPKMDGYDVIQKFKARPRFANTTCIILSQRDGVVDKLKGRIIGAVAYITKPFTTQELVAAVQSSIVNRCMQI